jgi:H+-transporting ATPase
VLGGVACLSSLIMLWAALDSWNNDGVFHRWGIGRMTYGKVTTMVYLKVSISDFLTLFSARTHEGFFFSSRPSPILLIACLMALSISTVLACVWPAGMTDKIRSEGLAYKTHYNQRYGTWDEATKTVTVSDTEAAIQTDYTLMPLWVWIYCIIWWWIQDACKVGCYWVLHKYNIFSINTDKIVNVRAARNIHDPKVPLARVSVGMVENKLLAVKVDDAIAKVDELARKSNTPQQLQRVSQSLGLMRTSMKTARVAAPGAKDAEAGAGGATAGEVTKQIGELEKSLASAAPETRAEIQVQLDSVKATATQIQKVQEAVATGKDTGANQ